MFCGKTDELLRRVELAQIARKHVLLVKPTIDTRYKHDAVVSHSGREFPCYLLQPGKETRENLVLAIDQGAVALISKMFGKIPLPEDGQLGRIILEQANIVAFDEGNFFDKELFPQLCQELKALSKDVIVAGLDLNFRAEPFGPMPELLALADEIMKLTAVCAVCGKPANRTQRMINGKPAPDGPEILVGGSETYEARCEKCFVHPSTVSQGDA